MYSYQKQSCLTNDYLGGTMSNSSVGVTRVVGGNQSIHCSYIPHP
jgi:hypothetical protein